MATQPNGVSTGTRNSLIETKVGAGSAATLIAGYAAWAIFTYVPGTDKLSLDLRAQLPVLIAWFLATAAAYFAPHTHRPDLVTVQAPVTPPPDPTLETGHAGEGT